MTATNKLNEEFGRGPEGRGFLGIMEGTIGVPAKSESGCRHVCVGRGVTENFSETRKKRGRGKRHSH